MIEREHCFTVGDRVLLVGGKNYPTDVSMWPNRLNKYVGKEYIITRRVSTSGFKLKNVDGSFAFSDTIFVREIESVNRDWDD